MKKNLVIVESPAKAKTLSKILGKGYSLKASIGHIRDLPKSRIGVDVESGFIPKYVVPRTKQKIVNELKKEIANTSSIYLATDPDREGEAISWHLAEVIKDKTDKKPYHRVVFHELTKDAIEHAFNNPRSINLQLVDAQQARRVLDRLVGYKISPLLWRKVRRGLSAGRVQSVALRLIVEREHEIEKFISVEYWTIEAELSKADSGTEKLTFTAMLAGYADGSSLSITNKNEAENIKKQLESAKYDIASITTKKVNRQPAPPFTTSTLQQEAWRKLRFSASQTMAIAQQLYEGLPVGKEGEVGLITYMRTDSTRVAEIAIAETRKYLKDKYGAKYVPEKARIFKTKARGAQEAHEAIRPTGIFREPSIIKPHLSNTQFRLYDLIWKRMVASQMAAATFDNTNIDINAKCAEKAPDYLFKNSTWDIIFPGFTALYSESKDDDEGKRGNGHSLPRLNKGDNLKILDLTEEQNFTQPPPRYTEATLIKMLEQKGIGRPSTYAPILSTIKEREYATREKGIFKPTELGVVVSGLLVEHFPDIFDVQFTARMEDELDDIAYKDKKWVDVVQHFYTPLVKNLDSAHENMEKVKLPDVETGEPCSKCGKPMVIKTGRFGKFIACSGYPDCKNTKPYQIKTGVKCPQCKNGEIIERISKKKRTFYGCSNYPDCQFATNLKPLAQPCPKCGGLLTEFGQDKTKCNNCSYKGKLSQE